jgi:hypothetical protein
MDRDAGLLLWPQVGDRDPGLTVPTPAFMSRCLRTPILSRASCWRPAEPDGSLWLPFHNNEKEGPTIARAVEEHRRVGGDDDQRMADEPRGCEAAAPCRRVSAVELGDDPDADMFLVAERSRVPAAGPSLAPRFGEIDVELVCHWRGEPRASRRRVAGLRPRGARLNVFKLGPVGGRAVAFSSGEDIARHFFGCVN